MSMSVSVCLVEMREGAGPLSLIIGAVNLQAFLILGKMDGWGRGWYCILKLKPSILLLGAQAPPGDSGGRGTVPRAVDMTDRYLRC